MSRHHCGCAFAHAKVTRFTQKRATVSCNINFASESG